MGRVVCGCVHTKVGRERTAIAGVPRFLTLGWVSFLFVSYLSAPMLSMLVKSIHPISLMSKRGDVINRTFLHLQPLCIWGKVSSATSHKTENSAQTTNKIHRTITNSSCGPKKLTRSGQVRKTVPPQKVTLSFALFSCYVFLPPFQHV